ncbi:MAG: TetR/AcrR family transcriptional regulator [Sterolibacterium sp.]|nr:TetR/AcrR family transcriptional regulator [Sterolibacterium sp.]
MDSSVDSLLPQRPRGRPKCIPKAQVINSLLDATELLIREHNYSDITEGKIATKAGVNRTMIYYYFGDKDGLLFGVITRRCEEIKQELNGLEITGASPGTVTRKLFKSLVDIYYAKPWISEFTASELGRNGSVVKEQFLKKYGSQGQGLVRLRRIFEQLIEQGVYDRRANAAHAALCMMSIVTAPLALTPLFGDTKVSHERFKGDDWIDFVSEMFDRQLRHP